MPLELTGGMQRSGAFSSLLRRACAAAHVGAAPSPRALPSPSRAAAAASSLSELAPSSSGRASASSGSTVFGGGRLRGLAAAAAGHRASSSSSGSSGSTTVPRAAAVEATAEGSASEESLAMTMADLPTSEESAELLAIRHSVSLPLSVCPPACLLSGGPPAVGWAARLPACCSRPGLGLPLWGG